MLNYLYANGISKGLGFYFHLTEGETEHFLILVLRPRKLEWLMDLIVLPASDNAVSIPPYSFMI